MIPMQFNRVSSIRYNVFDECNKNRQNPNSISYLTITQVEALEIDKVFPKKYYMLLLRGLKIVFSTYLI